MRVLHVTPSIDAGSGGTAAAVLGLTRAQAAAGLNVTLLTTDAHAVSAQYVDPGGVATRVIGPATGKLLRHADLSRVTRELTAAADVVHVHALWEEVQYQVIRAARAQRVPYVITPHGMLTRWSLAQRPWKKRLYMAWRLRAMLRCAAFIHYTSELERTDVAQSLALKPPSIIEPLGVNMDEFRTLPPRGTFRARYPQLGARPIVLFLGRLHPGKGLEHLLPAMAAVRRTEAMLVAVGPDSREYHAELQRRAASLGVSDRVMFTGLLQGTDKVAALVDADVFCLPSDHENFGVAVIEALAAGTPALVSAHVPVSGEIVERGAGSIVPQEARQLAAELDRWFDDEPLRRAAGERGKALAWERYDWLQIARRWPAHYRAAGVAVVTVPRIGDIAVPSKT
jgi:glycosyltransferase involved in cell wall biosynthesis